MAITLDGTNGITTETGTGDVSVGDDLIFTGTGNRITGDMSNATVTNRLFFQNSVTNGNSQILMMPNGTGTASSFIGYNSSDPTNASLAALQVIGSTDVRVQSAIAGTGTYLPMTFYTGGSERMRIDTSGNVLIGDTSGAYRLSVVNGRGGFGGSQNVGTLRTASGGLGGVECVSASASDAAFMAFHKPGAYASYFGIDTDNYFAVGGWSAGAGLANFKCSALSKASGSFKIDHPLPEKTETHHLVHSFVEAPQADNIYRGKVELVAGRAEVNIDTNSGMTEGTFVLLNREVQCFTSNESDWDAVRGSVNGNILTIECQNSDSTATISWLVIGERQDQHMYDTDWTDENGKVIVEPLKTVPQQNQQTENNNV
jgi:hypothetical protein